MTDKVQKIRKEVERIQLYTQSEVLKQVLDYIEKVQEEPVSKEIGDYDHKAVMESLHPELKEEPVSEDLEEEIEEYWKNAPTGTVYFPMWEHFQIIAHHFVEWGKKQAEIEIQTQSMAVTHGCPKEPVSEGLKIELEKYIKDHFTIDKEQLDRFGIEEKDYMYSMDKSDMLKMIRHFTNNYKVPTSDFLEEAAKLCVSDYFCITNEEDWDEHAVDALNIFKIAAKWQKEQFEKDYTDLCNGIATAKGIAVTMAYDKGMADAREQMMAEAINGVVHHFEKCKVACVYYKDPTGVPMAYFTSPEGLSAGDNVKIIVIKVD